MVVRRRLPLRGLLECLLGLLVSRKLLRLCGRNSSAVRRFSSVMCRRNSVLLRRRNGGGSPSGA